jgi:hypothetical protein
MALQITGGLLVATFIVAAWPAHAEKDSSCRGVPFISFDPITQGHISSKATRVHFVKDFLTQHGCPDQTPACVDKAYLVPGDRLIVTKRFDAFICAIYLNPKGNPRIGWLPADAVAYDTVKPIALTDWVGKWSWKWSYGDGDIDIGVAEGKTGTLSIFGVGTSNLLHEGQIWGEVAPTGDRLSFAMGDDGTTLPYEKGGESDCKIQMQRLGPWLIVNDEGFCPGGLNVSFRGVYTRKP